MKTTLEIPNPLFRQAKAAAAARGRTFKQLVNEALREKLSTRQAAPQPEWMKLFGSVKGHAKELRRIDKAIEEEFERIDSEKRKWFPAMKKGKLTPQQIAAYHRDGFIIARRLFDREEIGLLSRAAHEDRVLDQHSFSRDDGTGAKVRLSLWNHPGEGIYGMFARCRKLVDAVEQLLDDEAYHYHSKMIMKDAKVGGAWAWHQDYGYWYQNGVLTPNLCSVSIAVDAATKENGCLQVLKGSHYLGRVDHILSGEQAGADMERVKEAMKRYPLVYCAMQPGDALFFHSNLLHASARNDSDKPRWSMICCYNARKNDPYKEAHHPRYTPLKKVADTMIKKIGVKRFREDSSNVAFLEVQRDASATSLKKKLVAK